MRLSCGSPLLIACSHRKGFDRDQSVRGIDVVLWEQDNFLGETMIYLALGIPFLLLIMVAVMGAPFFYYLKRDLSYNATSGKTEAIRLQTWYGN